MAEAIRHALGLCGEHFHPNLWTLLIGGFGITTIFSYIVLYIKCKFKALAYTFNNTWQKLNKK
tara:strand:- start:257 stop:445 length:189 start_codon:yes stop_codon:yes gene_type:complete